MKATPPIVAVEHFSLELGGKRIVDDLSFTVERGEVFAFLGANGSGKTTTIRSLLGIYRPSAGTLLVDGQPYEAAMGSRLGYLPEERGLYGNSRVLDTMVYFGELKGLSAAEARGRASDFLERVGLADKARVNLRKLSGGQQQKVQLGVTVINNPELLILDEPTKGLDPVNRELLMELLLEHKERGATIIFITHQMDEVERLADRVMIIKDGRLRLIGSLAEIKRGYGQGLLQIDFDGKLPRHHETYTVNKLGHGAAQLKPQPGHSDQTILKALLASGLRIHGFEAAEPSLNDIFIDIYTRDTEGASQGE